MAIEALTPANQIQKTFDDLEAEKTLINTCTLQWKTLSDHFASLSKTLADRFRALDSKIQSLDSQTKETMASLNLHEAAIPDRESAAAALIESKKESAIKGMEDAESKTPSTKGEFLRLYCRRMDSSNLWKFMIAHRKDLSVLRREINEAITESVDACRLVIDAVDDFLKQGESVESGGDRCWAIGMLLRALFDSEGRKGPEVSEKIRERAAEVAVEWTKKIGGKEEGGEMGAAEAQIFLQMVVAFGLSSRFEEEELRKLVLEHASRKEMAKLAAGLGFGEKMADIIDELIKTGKELEAVSFTCESGLIEKFSPTPLLKNYLHNSRKKASDIAKSGKNSAAALEESTNVELNSIRSIIKTVEYYKLESKFNIEGLKKRITSIEKSKSDRKKTAAVTKSNAKRARASASSTTGFRPSKAVRTAGAPYPSSFPRPPTHPSTRHSYNYPIQGGGHLLGLRQPYYGGYEQGAPHAPNTQIQYPH